MESKDKSIFNYDSKLIIDWDLDLKNFNKVEWFDLKEYTHNWDSEFYKNGIEDPELDKIIDRIKNSELNKIEDFELGDGNEDAVVIVKFDENELKITNNLYKVQRII